MTDEDNFINNKINKVFSSTKNYKSVAIWKLEATHRQQNK